MIRFRSQNARLSVCTTVSLALLSIGSPILAVPSIDLGRGPVDIYLPSSYDPNTPTPLVILLHGFTGDGATFSGFFNFGVVAEANGMIFAAPNGTVDTDGNRFWNATDVCCDLYSSNVDDSGYLRSLVEAIKVDFNIDDRRIYFAGLSNGGFMSYRMACDHADLIAAIVSVAGATFDNAGDCTPSEPVHVLEIHGTADSVVLFSGGLALGIPYPGAIQSVETWAGYNGCDLTPEIPPDTLDLDANIPGAETTIRRYPQGCRSGGSAELWTVNGGPHVLTGTPAFGESVAQFLLSHPKPRTPPVPTVSEWGMLAFVLLLMTVGTLMLRRRSAVIEPAP